MFDFLRNLTKTEAEKQQETLSAYLDNALTPAEREKFETRLSADTTLRANLEQQRRIKENVGQLPRLRAPRNFTLDPAVYGRPAPQPAVQLYPIMRAATALAAVLLIFLFSLQFFSPTLYEPDTVSQAPVTANGVFEESSGTASDEDMAGAPVPAAVPEIMSEEAGEAAADVEEAAEEAMETEAEEEMEEAEEEAAAPPAEPEAAAEVTVIEGTSVPTRQPQADTGEAETTVTGGDGTVVTQELTPTLTLRTDITTTDNFLYTTPDEAGEAQPIPTVEPGTIGANDSTPIPPLRLLQIGLGILFLVLLTATWLLRRQL